MVRGKATESSATENLEGEKTSLSSPFPARSLPRRVYSRDDTDMLLARSGAGQGGEGRSRVLRFPEHTRTVRPSVRVAATRVLSRTRAVTRP